MIPLDVATILHDPALDKLGLGLHVSLVGEVAITHEAGIKLPAQNMFEQKKISSFLQNQIYKSSLHRQ